MTGSGIGSSIVTPTANATMRLSGGRATRTPPPRPDRPVDRDGQIETSVSDDEIWTPVWVLAGTIAVTGGSVSGRREAVAHIRQLLGANLDRFRVLAETSEAAETTLSFQAATVTEHEDWALEAISAACHTASSLNPAAAEPSVNASVVSLRTRRQIAD